MTPLTDEQRARLVEVMARGMCVSYLEDPDALDNNVADGVFLPNWTRHQITAHDAIAAAESAGFKIEALSDG